MKFIYVVRGMKSKSVQETTAFLREILFKIEIFMVTTEVRLLPGHTEMRILWLSIVVLS